MKTSLINTITLLLAVFVVPGCHKHEEHHEEAHKIVATSPVIKDVTITQQYVGNIRSRRHIEVKALESGYLEEIEVKEGQAVKKGDLLFKIVAVLYKAKYDSEVAEFKQTEIEYSNTKMLFERNVVAQPELLLAQAKLAKAEAKMKLAQAELNFTDVKAPFDGIIDRLKNQQGSLIEEGDVLTTLSDNEVMWVYFSVPEARYLEYKRGLEEADDGIQIQLLLQDGIAFQNKGKIGAIEADFNNETGNIQFRADFTNIKGLLRNGQVGSVLINRPIQNAVVIPQRATFEILDKRYVFLIGKDNIAKQHEVIVLKELEDIFVVKKDLGKDDKIVLEGVRQIRDGDKVEFEFRDPKEILANLKNTAE